MNNIKQLLHRTGLALVLLCPMFAIVAEENATNKVPHLYSPNSICAIKINGVWESYEHIVSTKDLENCLYGSIGPEDAGYDLERFKAFEQKFAEHGWRIYSVRLYGKSILQYVMTFYEEHVDRGKISREKADELIDYILAHITSQELNECVETCWEPAIYYGTAAAYAAVHSPTCFKKIIARPDFDPLNFIHSRLALHHRLERWQPYYSLTPSGCVRIIENRQDYRRKYIEESLELLNPFVEMEKNLTAHRM